VDVFDRALALSRSAGDHKQEAAILCALGEAHTALSNWKQAVVSYEEAMKAARKVKDRKTEEFCIITLAATRRAYRESAVYEGRRLFSVAEQKEKMGHYDEALVELQHVLQICRDVGDKRSEVECLTKFAEIYLSQANPDKATQSLKKALKIAQNMLYDSKVPRILNLLATIYFSQGNYPAAEPLYLQALELGRATLGEADPSIASGLNNLGNLYFAMGNYQAAESLFLQAVELGRRLPEEARPLLVLNLRDLASLYCTMGNNAAAESLSNEALEIEHTPSGE
jgi:tetratricopeptide (TPR) repeat protein